MKGFTHRLRVLVCILLGTFSGIANTYALGLRQIQLSSALNQPLHAKIPLVDTGQWQAADIKVALASRETFSRLNIPRQDILSHFTFDVTQQSDGQLVIAIQSDKAIKQPVIHLLIDIAWPAGQLIRQYTILLSPAFFDHLQNQVSQTKPKPLPNTAPVSVSVKQALKTIGPIVKSDSLWHIASDLRKHFTGVTQQQMMVALYQTNPNAFHHNMNSLKLGARLTIPSLATIQATAQPTATHLIANQGLTWHHAKLTPQTKAIPAITVNPIKSAPPKIAFIKPPAEQLEPLAFSTDKTPLQQKKIKTLSQELAIVTESNHQESVNITLLKAQLAEEKKQKNLLQQLVTDQQNQIQLLNQRLTKLDEQLNAPRTEPVVPEPVVQRPAPTVVIEKTEQETQFSGYHLVIGVALGCLVLVLMVFVLFKWLSRQRQAKVDLAMSEVDLTPNPEVYSVEPNNTAPQENLQDKEGLTAEHDFIQTKAAIEAAAQQADNPSASIDTPSAEANLAAARDYINRQDYAKAKTLLQDVLAKGDMNQQAAAEKMLASLPSSL